jgi:4-hydroxybenzoate polyprenyltransferase
MQSIKKYLSLVKFSHTIFAMPFALIGLFMGFESTSRHLDWRILIYVVLCMVFARNAAMGFNRFIDRRYDAKNPRTAVREIPAGIISEQSALLFVIINCILFIATTYFINSLCFYLSPIALFVVLGYSLTKRFTALCHLVLGIGLSLAPIGAYLAVTNAFALAPILLGCAVLFWVSGFDIIYALQDDAFDKSQNLNSIPVFLGRKNALLFSRCLHVVAFICIVLVLFIMPFHFIYSIGILFFGFFLVYQHLLVKANDLSKVNLAFFTLNGIASVVFAVLAISDLLVY